MENAQAPKTEIKGDNSWIRMGGTVIAEVKKKDEQAQVAAESAPPPRGHGKEDCPRREMATQKQNITEAQAMIDI